MAGVINFLELAEKLGYKTRWLGPAVSMQDLVFHIKEYDPDIVGVSYRLTPENAEILIDELKEAIETHKLQKRWVFGGTVPVCEVAETSGIL